MPKVRARRLAEGPRYWRCPACHRTLGGILEHRLVLGKLDLAQLDALLCDQAGVLVLRCHCGGDAVWNSGYAKMRTTEH